MLDKKIRVRFYVFCVAFIGLLGVAIYLLSTKNVSAEPLMPLASNMSITGTVVEWQQSIELVMNASIALGFMLGLAVPYFFRPIGHYLLLRARWYRRFHRQSRLV